MNDQCYDPRHIKFAKYLGCAPELVEEIYLQTGVDHVPDREEANDLRTAIHLYETAERALNQASKALQDLPDVERAARRIGEKDWIKPLQQMQGRVGGWLRAARTSKARSEGSGPENKHAGQFGEFVAVLFEALNRDITFGVDAISSEPSTDFGRAVQQGIQIYSVRKPPVEKQKNTPLSGGRAKIDVTLFDGEYIGWRRIAERAFKRRQG